ncbi:MAG: hypothetical protein Q4C12_08060 [Clostridia bacterium]|nr:hypothetical protein [Clostridia bacterium]
MQTMTYSMQGGVDVNIPKEASEIIERLTAAGFEAYAVGGCVRDALMGRTPKDIDVATNALPVQIKNVFSDCVINTKGEKYGCISVKTPMGRTVEITTFRSEGDYADHRHPRLVHFVQTIEEDLARRDFTINALAYNEQRGLVDIFGGERDIRDRRIACIGDADARFGEDALRMLRALRFASELDFEIDSSVEKSIHKNHDLISFVPRETLHNEMERIMRGTGAKRLFEQFRDII